MNNSSLPSPQSDKEIRLSPPPLQKGIVNLLRFFYAHKMLNVKYVHLLVRLQFLKLRWGARLQTDGLAFIGEKVKLEIGSSARVSLGRWSLIGRGCKIRAHEGSVEIGAKTVLGQECTLTAFQNISIGRECIFADRVMLIDFDHCIAEVERPIRLQGIYKRDVEVGHNCWLGYGVQILRGVKVGNNCVIGAGAVVTKDIPDNAVAAGVPAKVIRMRDEPKRMQWG